MALGAAHAPSPRCLVDRARGRRYAHPAPMRLGSLSLVRALVACALIGLWATACAEGTEALTPGSGGGAAAAAGAAGTAGSDASAGSGGASGAAGDASADVGVDADGGGDASACQGVVCNAPPASQCSGANLQVYEPNGTCGSDGSCSYASSVVSCPSGCASGSCIGDPCIGVTCNTPPASFCSSATHRTVYQSPGTCGGNGSCSYQSIQAFCPFGCVNDVCQGDPCAGVTCTSPPSNYCKDASYLVANQSPGSCGSSGQCSYNTVDVFCAFGCSGSQCQGDPCAGVNCVTPPANNCKDASTARIYSTPGSCASGACSYSFAEISCSYGCVGGVCNNCQLDAHCPSGQWCQSGSCTPCNDSAHCGAACTNCAATGKVCNAGQCVDCVGTGSCGSGKYCSNNVCLDCNTNSHCGPSCVACGPGSSCAGGACAPCDTNASCGATCSPCGGATPHCKAQGTASVCVQCLSNAHCSGGQVCNTSSGSCGPPCPTTLTGAFSADFTAPASATWYSGTDVQLNTSPWKVYANAQHGVRINGGRLGITNKRGSSSVGHGHGYAYVRTGGAGSAYDNQLYNPTLKGNTGQEVVWSLNLRRDNPESTNGGFSCLSTSSQNDITVGLAYVLATDSAAGLNASAGTCASSGASVGYAVVVGGSNRVRLVRFSGGLRNGALTTLVESGTFTVSNYFSARVTYNAVTDQWRLEARNDGTSTFADPAAGSYTFSGTATDGSYVNQPLEFSGPYFQTGCCCLCSSTYNALFDNVRVGLRCAP